MHVLIKDHNRAGPHAALLFGLGMIGSAIREALERLEFRPVHHVGIDWPDPGRRAQAYALARQICVGLAPSPSRISITWSAGKANFFSSDSEIEVENQCFTDTLQLALDLQQALYETNVEFHFLSSAGGLFEGQRIVGKASRPAPQRSYGRMKLSQENKIRRSLSGCDIAIYRPSSVYGPMVVPRRHGLVNQLIANASNRRTSILDANVMALRDYVYAGDVGEFIARNITFPNSSANSESVHFLVSARCASIFEVVATIERVLQRKLRYRFDEHFGNSANITFSDGVLPPGWWPSTLDVGIRQFMLLDWPQSRS